MTRMPTIITKGRNEVKSQMVKLEIQKKEKEEAKINESNVSKKKKIMIHNSEFCCGHGYCGKQSASLARLILQRIRSG